MTSRIPVRRSTTELWSLMGARPSVSSIYTRHRMRMRQLIHAKHVYLKPRILNTGDELTIMWWMWIWLETGLVSVVISANITDMLKMKWPSRWRSNLSSYKVKPWKKFRASTGFEPMTSGIPVRRSNHWAMKPYGSKTKCEFNLYPSQDEDETIYTR